MLPVELEGEIITLPETDNHSIVVATGTSLRHRRFAYRIQKAFGDLVVAVYELDENIAPKYMIDLPTPKVKKASKIEKVFYLLKREFSEIGEIDRGMEASDMKSIASMEQSVSVSIAEFIKKTFSYAFKNGIFATVRKGSNFLIAASLMARYSKSLQTAEKELFEKEIEELKGYAKLTPIKINPMDVGSTEFIAEVQRLNPYFFLTLGGPLYKKQLLEAIRGAAINQHAGHSPVFKGGRTTDWALYHRNINYVSNTVHITTTGADDGPILRRSNPCIFPKDNLHKIFARVIAVGTELMIESVEDIIRDKKVMVFKQPKKIGRTYLDSEYSSHIINSLRRDFRTDWLRDELGRLRNF